MTNGDMHLTGDALEEYLDGAMPAAERADAARHLASCPGCRERARELASLGGAIAALPREQLDARFTGELLEKLGVTGASRALSLAGWMAGVIGLAFVACVVLAVFMATGVVPSGAPGDQWVKLQEYWRQGGGWLTGGLGALGHWLDPLVPASPSLKTLLSAALVLAVLALCDRFLGRRLLRGQHGS